MYGEDELIPLSGLQHLMFCERQAALIHVERLWFDNRFTIEGTHLHRRVDEEAPRREVRGDVVILRGLALRSWVLGLVGRADVVELHRSTRPETTADPSRLPSAVKVADLPGWWTLLPVDYKRGRPKTNPCDEVQLCAQATCLEEMLRVRVCEGALFYGRERRRHAVAFNDELRDITRAASIRLHKLISSDETPRAVPGPKCEKCSLIRACLPKVGARRRSVRAYLKGVISERDAQEGHGR